MNERILAVSAHPDDETLGAGGTLLRHKRRGDKIYWLNITNMKTSFNFKSHDVEKRRKEIKRVFNEYGFDGFADLALKPSGLETYKKKYLIEKISGVFKSIKPTTVILPYRNDAHTDHRIVFENAYSSAKAFRHPYIKKVLMMEVLSETDFAFDGCAFSPNYFVNISDHLEKKIKIAKIYKGEIKKHPFPRSAEALKALAVLRGAKANCRYAEGFIALKYIC